MSFAATLKLGKAKPRVQRNSPPQLASMGWSLKAAAAQIGCDFSHLSRVIAGERAMTRDMESRIASLPDLTRRKRAEISPNKPDQAAMNTNKTTTESRPSGEISTETINHLEKTVSHAVGLLSLLAAAATMDRSRHGPLSLAESDAIIGLAYDTGADLNLASNTIALADDGNAKPALVIAGEWRAS